MNSVLQCLFRVKPLVDFVLGPDFERNLNPHNPFRSHAQLACQFRELVRNLQNSRSAVQPSAFKRALAVHYEVFADWGQHDANECLMIVLDAIHEDLNQSLRALGKPIDTPRLTGMELYNATNKSEVTRLFYGVSQTRTDFECNRYNEVLEEPLAVWSLPLPKRSSLRLEECIDLWREPEHLSGENQGFCRTCNRSEDITRTVIAIQFAPILIIHLKRFKETLWGVQKNGAPVTYPFKIDSAQYAQCPTGVYSLFAVVCHSGSLEGGHYTCVVKDQEGLKWYNISDSHVRECREQEAMQSSAYILFYENRQR
jgi:ubiquitin carboxyl-terminal hydrolase 8